MTSMIRIRHSNIWLLKKRKISRFFFHSNSIQHDSLHSHQSKHSILSLLCILNLFQHFKLINSIIELRWKENQKIYISNFFKNNFENKVYSIFFNSFFKSHLLITFIITLPSFIKIQNSTFDFVKFSIFWFSYFYFFKLQNFIFALPRCWPIKLACTTSLIDVTFRVLLFPTIFDTFGPIAYH